MKLIFNCFDEDGNGTLSRDEFGAAAKRFSTRKEALDTFVNKVFKECDSNLDGKVTLSEFFHWQAKYPQDFEDFVGTINILKTE